MGRYTDRKMPDALDQNQVTTVLAEWKNGSDHARDRLIDLIYGELRKMAAASLRNERKDHTLQPTALVHEMYLRLFGAEAITLHDRNHLFAVAARQMRRILIDHARAIQSEKRGGGGMRVSLDQAGEVASTREQDVLDVDAGLSQLPQLDQRAAEVVELRFFAGMTESQAAAVIGISVATLKRDWEFARVWLAKHLGERAHSAPPHFP